MRIRIQGTTVSLDDGQISDGDVFYPTRTGYINSYTCCCIRIENGESLTIKEYITDINIDTSKTLGNILYQFEGTRTRYIGTGRKCHNTLPNTIRCP